MYSLQGRPLPHSWQPYFHVRPIGVGVYQGRQCSSPLRWLWLLGERNILLTVAFTGTVLSLTRRRDLAEEIRVPMYLWVHFIKDYSFKQLVWDRQFCYESMRPHLFSVGGFTDWKSPLRPPKLKGKLTSVG